MSEGPDEREGIVEDADGITVVRGSGITRGWNGIRYKAGMWAENVGSTALSMNVATIPSEAAVKVAAPSAQSSNPVNVARAAPVGRVAGADTVRQYGAPKRTTRHGEEHR